MRRALAVVAVVALPFVTGCASEAARLAEAPGMRIEVLGFTGCPNTPAMRARVRDAVERSGVPAQVTYVDQESLPSDDLRRGYPSPTVLVDGDDLYGLPVPTAPVMGCRVYPGGLPTVDNIASRLSERR